MSTESSLQKIAALRASALSRASEPIEWPEPAMVLDLDSRHGSDVRMFKHIHQLCSLHTENFRSAWIVKQVYLLDGYLTMAAAGNPYGTYSFARIMLENSGAIHRISADLSSAAALARENWLQGGQKFFGIMVRASYATSQSDLSALSAEAGLSADRRKTMSSGEMVKGLAEAPGHENVWDRYQNLCDFVHHNLGSKTLGNAGSRVSGHMHTNGGGMFLLPSEGAITRYQYPNPTKAELAVAMTVEDFADDAADSVRWMNAMPAGPFGQEQVLQFTGTKLGLVELDADLQPVSIGSVAGRNEPCPCGSGKKYKHCCFH